MEEIKPIDLDRTVRSSVLKTTKADARDANGGSHTYVVTYHPKDGEFGPVQTIQFQNGPVKEVGPNGIQNEDLLKIVLDRMEGFNTGPYRCRENSLAITHLEEAIHWLDHRTRDREDRGVEGSCAI